MRVGRRLLQLLPCKCVPEKTPKRKAIGQKTVHWEESPHIGEQHTVVDYCLDVLFR
jgi:hypothetical protein